MAFVSPVMIAFVGRFWPSALILYWLTFNVLTMGQQYFLMRRYAPARQAAAVPAVVADDDADAKAALASAAVRPQRLEPFAAAAARLAQMNPNETVRT